MKKFVILMCCFLFTSLAFAQEIVKVEMEYINPRIGVHRISLSNGDELVSYATNNWERRSPDKKTVDADFINRHHYPQGTLVHKSEGGLIYRLVNLKKIGTYTISKARIHEVNSEMISSMSADYSYRMWMLAYAKGTGKQKETSSGGTRTIVNLFFSNGQNATIEASSDPIWLDAEEGMQVEHWQWKDYNVYKLL